MGMLPEKFPTRADRDDVQLYASLTPAKEVGGDLFDFYFRDEKLFFCIGDVSGKGHEQKQHVRHPLRRCA